jgi:hypothetical protein
MIAVHARVQRWAAQHVAAARALEPQQQVLRTAGQRLHVLERAIAQALLVHPAQQPLGIGQRAPVQAGGVGFGGIAHCLTS